MSFNTNTIETVLIGASTVYAKAPGTGGDESLIVFQQNGKTMAQFTSMPNNTGLRLHTYNNGVWATYVEFKFNETIFNQPVRMMGTLQALGSATFAGTIHMPYKGETIDFYNKDDGNSCKGKIGYANSDGNIYLLNRTSANIILQGTVGFLNCYGAAHDNSYNFRTSQSFYWFDKSIQSTGFYNTNLSMWTVCSTNVSTFRDVNNYLEIAGVGYAKGIYYTVSDIKLKKDIKPTSVNQALNIINKLNHVQFDWIDTGDHVNIGYIANHVKDVMSDLVFSIGQPDGSSLYNINQTTLLPLITLSIQELDKKTTEREAILEQKIKETEAKINYLIEIINKGEIINEKI